MFELQPPEPDEFERLEPLAGVRWPAAEVAAPVLEGQVPMFDVEDEGELQEW